jgi:hypothetical protein
VVSDSWSSEFIGWSAADFCGVVCPVAGGEPLPGNGDVGVDAEGAGKDCCGDLGGELEQCGAASGAGTDAVFVQPLGQLAGAGGPAKLATRKEPDRKSQHAGIWPGANRHPGSFCAPMADFLAAEELKTQIEEFAIALAASGRRMAIELDPGDRRIAVRLSSDPDERVVPIIGTGFGDPV